MNDAIILNTQQIALTVKRLARQLVEEHDDFANAVVIGLQPRGVEFAHRVVNEIREFSGTEVPFGTLDITFHRDDFRRRSDVIQPNKTDIRFPIEDKCVILADDVLYTGRSARAGLDALLTYGRPSRVELMALVDRRFSRHLPVQADYVGRWVDAIASERVSVIWSADAQNDQVKLYTPKV